MAGEEQDSELRDLVAESLEAKGVLGKIRAQLRASVFLALEEQEAKEKPHPLANERLRAFLETKDGKEAAGLVREFLEFFELDFSCSVFDPESNVLETYKGRDELAKDTRLDHVPKDRPLLLEVLKRAKISHPPSLSNTLPPLTSGGSTLSPLSLPSTISSAPPLFSTPHITGTTLSLTDRQPVLTMATTTTPTATQDSTLFGRPTGSTSGHLFKSADDKFQTDASSLKNRSLDIEELIKSTLSDGGDITNGESDVDLSQVSARSQYDTTDHTLSQTSNSMPGEYDYTEQIQ